MEFEKRKSATLATINSLEPDKSPKGNIDIPIIPLLNTLNSHHCYFTTSSCSGRISIFAQPKTPCPSSKKKAKGGKWLFISHDYPVDPYSVVQSVFNYQEPEFSTSEFSSTGVTSYKVTDSSHSGADFMLHDQVYDKEHEFPTSGFSSAGITSDPQDLDKVKVTGSSHPRTGVCQKEPEFLGGPHSLVFRFEPLIIAVECRDIESAQFMVSLAISCGFRESGITSVSKRVIIAIRCSIRLEVPLGDTEKIMVSEDYVKYLVELANEKMVANRKRTDSFLDALLKNGFSLHGHSVKELMINGNVGSAEELGCGSTGKLETLVESSTNGWANDEDDQRRDLDHSKHGLSEAPRMDLLMSKIPTVGEPAERLFLWGHSACAVGSTNHKKVLVFGGFGGIGRHARRNDLLLLDPDGWKIEAVSVQEAPSPRLGHTGTVVQDCMYALGGRGDPLDIMNDVWAFRIETGEWSLLHCSGALFSPRHRHAAAAVGSKIYIFGGILNTGISSSLYVFDTQNLEWSEISIQGEWPSPRHSHSMLAHGNYLYMFGGYNGEKALGDLYTFNIQSYKWKKLKMGGRKPCPRFSHSMFVYKDYLCIIGGCPINQHHKELSLLELKSCSWKHIMVDSIGSDLFVRSTANVIGDDLIMIGGGASCYAFGTRFSEPVKISLLPLTSLGDNSLSPKGEEVRSHYGETESTEKGNLNCNVSYSDSDGNAPCQSATSYWILRLERKYGKVGKDVLKMFGWLDLERKVFSQEDGRYICFPVVGSFCPLFIRKRNNLDAESELLVNIQPLQLEEPNLQEISESAALDLLISFGATEHVDEIVKVKRAAISPLKLLKEAVSTLIEQKGLPLRLLEQLPSRWDRLGDIIVLPVSSFKDQAWEIVGEDLWPIVAQSLGARRLARQGRIASNGTRDSRLEILVGDNGWVEHRENGILYSFDATKCMFSWGNLSEKLRTARLVCKDEVVVDLFAGIGYFTLPFLARAGAKLVYACEWNPHAIEALRRNLHANSVEDRCVILEGDNRITAPVGVADRVSLGLLPTSEGSWVTAVRALRSDGGMLHIHGNVKDVDECSWTEHVSQSIHDIARSEGHCWEVSVVHVERVKWYAPHIRHLVADVRCKKV